MNSIKRSSIIILFVFLIACLIAIPQASADEPVVAEVAVVLEEPTLYSATAFFKWNVEYDGWYNKYDIQISTSPDFGADTTITLSSQKLTLTHTFDVSGVYYARIKGYGETVFAEDWIISYESHWSETITFTVPVYSTRIISGGVNKQYIKLSWNTGLSDYLYYLIEYSYNSDFTDSDIYVLQNDGTTSVNIENNLIPGIRYYFRIRNVTFINNKALMTAWSNPITLTYKLEKPYIKNLQVRDNSIVVNWNKIDNCTSYVLWYSTDPNFDVWQSELLTVPGTSSSTVIKDLPSGTYYFKICAANKVEGLSQVYSDWSNPKSIKLNVRLPKTYLTNQYSANETLKFFWKDIRSPEFNGYECGYELQYSDNPNFDNAQTVKSRAEEPAEYTVDARSLFHTNISENYYVRIRTYKEYNSIGLTNEEYTCYSDWSNTKTVKYKLTKPYITNITMNENNETYTSECIVSITECHYCVYELEISSDPTFPGEIYDDGRLVFFMRHNSLRTNKVNVTLDAIGTLYFRVRAVRYNENGDAVLFSDWSNVKSINNFGATPEIKELSTKYNKLYCKWETSELYDWYLIVCCGQSSSAIYQIDNQSGEALLNMPPDMYNVFVMGRYYENDGSTALGLSSQMKSVYYNIVGTDFEFINTIDGDVNVKWLRSSGCHGYQIQYSNSKEFDKNVVTKLLWNTDTVNCTIEDLKAGSYYFRIRTYKEIDGTRYYSDWSNAQSIDFN